MQPYLRSTTMLDYDHPRVAALARELSNAADSIETITRCFHWVRDEVRHSLDYGDHRVTLSASEVLLQRTGLCYAKSHLLAALLRANGIPCGLVYQRLSDMTSRSGFCLHGLNAVWLPAHGWFRLDPRGNRTDLATCFAPPTESLAFETTEPGESTIAEVFSDPLPVVVHALTTYATMDELRQNLPDWLPQGRAE